MNSKPRIAHIADLDCLEIDIATDRGDIDGDVAGIDTIEQGLARLERQAKVMPCRPLREEPRGPKPAAAAKPIGEEPVEIER